MEGAYDYFKDGLQGGLSSTFFQVGEDVILASKDSIGFLGSIGSLGVGTDTTADGVSVGIDLETLQITEGIVLKGVQIGDLGEANFIFPAD